MTFSFTWLTLKRSPVEPTGSISYITCALIKKYKRLHFFTGGFSVLQFSLNFGECFISPQYLFCLLISCEVNLYRTACSLDACNRKLYGMCYIHMNTYAQNFTATWFRDLTGAGRGDMKASTKFSSSIMHILSLLG